MALDGKRTLVGFGLGPIQTGVFVHEACRSGNFGRIVIGEVLPEIVEAVREAEGRICLNVAHRNSVESLTLGPLEILNPTDDGDREVLVDAVRQASEVATAVPSVRHYSGQGPGGIDQLLARGLAKRDGRPLIVYAAENHKDAAAILRRAVFDRLATEKREELGARAAFLNTVIGKMSGVLGDPADIEKRGLLPLTPGGGRCHLLEEFNRILIEQIPASPGWEPDPGITVFEEKEDLRPFEDAKLHGHNAAHAFAAYLAAFHGLERMSELPAVEGGLTLIRAALVEESGAALIHRHGGADPLFTPDGFRDHADDLIPRMLNPHLGDLVERVARDPERKLGWNDRLVGTMRLALDASIRPVRFAVGAAAALVYLRPEFLRGGPEARKALQSIWSVDRPEEPRACEILELIDRALAALRDQEHLN